MKLTYAIGDVHGCLTELQQMVLLINSDAAGEAYRLVFLGDYIDRGPNSSGVIDFCMGLAETGTEDIFLMGNHEDLALHNRYGWLLNGGVQTEASYPDGKMSPDHIEWMASLPTYHETETNIFVHAGIGNFKDLPMEEQRQENLLWRRYRDDEEAATSKVMIHGHTPNDGVITANNRICIDTACVFGGMLTAAKLEEGNPYPVDYFHVETTRWS